MQEIYDQIQAQGLRVLEPGSTARMPTSGDAGEVWAAISQRGYGMYQLADHVGDAFRVDVLIQTYMEEDVAEAYAARVARGSLTVHAKAQEYTELKRIGKLVMDDSVDPLTGNLARLPSNSALWRNVNACLEHHQSFFTFCHREFSVDFLIIKSWSLR